jgi:Uncharacterized conserved protein (DUF2190)
MNALLELLLVVAIVGAMLYLFGFRSVFATLFDWTEDIAYLVRYGNLGARNRADRRAIRQSIKRLRKLQEQGIYVYGATNRLRVKGSPLTVTLTGGGVTAGSPGVAWTAAIANGGLAGIVESAKDGNNNAVLHTEGVWSVTFVVVTGLAIGDPIYVIPATGVLTQTAASNLPFAKSLVALGAGSAAVTMKLVGSN